MGAAFGGGSTDTGGYAMNYDPNMYAAQSSGWGAYPGYTDPNTGWGAYPGYTAPASGVTGSGLSGADYGSLIGSGVGLGLTALNGYQGQRRLGQVPTNWSTTQGSYLSGGVLGMDPQVADLRNQYLAMLPGLQSQISGYTQAGQDVYNQLLQSGLGNQQNYINSIVNPAAQNIAQQQGQLQQGMVNRGLGGSSFYNQQVSDQATRGNQALADIQAQATQSSLGTIGGLASQRQALGLGGAAASTGLGQQYANVANQISQQELTSLGLGADSSARILQAMNARNQQQGQTTDALGQFIQTALPIVAAALLA